MGLLSSIGKFAGNVIGGIIGGGSSSAGNAVGNTIGTTIAGGINSKQAYDYQVKLDKQNYEYNKQLQKYAYDLNQQGVTNAPALLRKGYENADLNPILAYSNTNAPSVNATGFSSSPGGALATNAQANAANARLINAQTEKIQAETHNIGNTPKDIILNGIKGFMGFGNASNNDVAYELGKRLKNMSPGLKKKLLDFGSQFGSSDNTSAGYLLKGGVSYNATNSHDFKIPNLTREEEKLLNDVVKSAQRRSRRKPLSTPPRELPQ